MTLNKIWQYKKISPCVFELYAPKAVIKGVFSRSYCCYGNLLCHENDNNASTNDWAICDTVIVASSGKQWL